MIRFLNLGSQISMEDGDVDFAFYDTVADRILEFSGNQVWPSWADFELDYIGDDLERFRRLIPEELAGKI